MLNIAAIQMDTSTDNLARADALIAEAARAGADFAVLPELAGCPWLPAREEEGLLAMAEPDDGPTLRALRGMAARHGVNLIAPLYEADGARRYSTAYVLGRDGAVIGKYRKNHIPNEPGWYEKFYFHPGDCGFPVFNHEGLRFGIQICWDNNFPEGTRILALKGAQVVFAPRATGFGTLNRWQTVLAANAAVNQVFVLSANRVGFDRGTRFGGGSIVLNPAGEIVAQAPPAPEPAVVVASVDLNEIAAARQAEPFLANRRPDIYTVLTQG